MNNNYKFGVFKNTLGFSWLLQAPNGETILRSESYNSLTGCQQGVTAAKIQAAKPSQYEKRQENGSYYFLLKAKNGEVLARSQTYTTEKNRDNAILLITRGIGKSQAPPSDKHTKTLTLIEFVKERRKKAGLSQEELAEKAGVGIRFLRELEQGKETLRLDKINQVLKLFGHEMRPAPVSPELDNI
jgi:y4mF family transcriptional regulator